MFLILLLMVVLGFIVCIVGCDDFVDLFFCGCGLLWLEVGNTRIFGCVGWCVEGVHMRGGRDLLFDRSGWDF